MHVFEFYGGSLALDFTNTVDSRAMPVDEDHVHTYADLVGWAHQSGALDDATRHRLLSVADGRPDEARERLAAAAALREAIFRTFRAVADGAPPAADDLAMIQRAYAEAMAHADLAPTAAGFGWTWPDDALDLPAWLVARSAVELATTGPLERLKVCASDGGCAALFLDSSKNRSRRWCTMAGCGNEVKFRRQAARRRTARR